MTRALALAAAAALVAIPASKRPRSGQHSWREDATKERITFGFLPPDGTLEEPPDLQQVVSFDGHRPR